MANEPNKAKQLYMEQFGDALVTNAYLKIALALLSFAVVGLVVLNVKTIHIFRNFKPLVIRIDELGRAQAVSYNAFAYKPEAKMAAYKKQNVIGSFLDNPSSPEVDIDVQQVALEPMIKPPYKASVDFYRTEYSPTDHSVLKKTLCTASFVFMFRSPVPNQMIPINPLGLTITYFREDEAFN